MHKMALRYTNDLTPQEYKDFRASVGWFDVTLSQATRVLKNTPIVVCVRDGDKAIGMGRLLFDGGCAAYVADIIVDKAYRGQGIGKTIVESLCQQAVDSLESGEHMYFILSSVKDKEAFYEKLGFISTPNENAGHGMRKDVIKA